MPTPTLTESAPQADTDARFPWRGGFLVAVRDRDEATVPTFRVEGVDEPAPDFSGLLWKQLPDYGYSYGAPQYASLEDGEVLVFDDARTTASGDYAHGVFRWTRDGGARFEALPVPASYGAFFPTALVASASDDVWVGAAIKREPFEPDFPGCPITVWSSLDDVYLAHWDGHAWSQAWSPRAMGRLRDLSVHDGTLTVETGWGPDLPQYLEGAAADATWERSPKGVWTKKK